MKRLFLAFLLTGCAAHQPMVSHDGSDTPNHIEALSGQAAVRIAETYPAGTTVLHIHPDVRDPRFAASLERMLRMKGYAFSPSPGTAGISLAYQTDRLSERSSYVGISSSDGREFTITHNFQD